MIHGNELMKTREYVHTLKNSTQIKMVIKSKHQTIIDVIGNIKSHSRMINGSTNWQLHYKHAFHCALIEQNTVIKLFIYTLRKEGMCHVALTKLLET